MEKKKVKTFYETINLVFYTFVCSFAAYGVFWLLLNHNRVLLSIWIAAVFSSWIAIILWSDFQRKNAY